MDVAHPQRALVPSLDGDVLVVLAGTTSALTGRQVAELAHRGSQRAVSDVLDRLVEQGLVLRETAGRAYLHTLNRDHLLAPAVEVIASLRAELFARIAHHVDRWPIVPITVAVFGSTARGDGTTASDIDLLVIRPDGVDVEDDDWRDPIDDLTTSIFRWTGNHASVIELSEDELPELLRRDPPVVTAIRDDAVDIAGQPVRTLLRRRR